MKKHLKNIKPYKAISQEIYNYDKSRKVEGEVHITADNKIVESMYSALNYKVNTMLASSYAIISSIDQKNILLK